RLSGRRVIVQAPGSLLGRIPSDATLFPLARAPHDILFPRCSAIVHHGGAGTTQTAVRAGRPSVVVPHLMDQFFWGDLLYRRGMAPPPIRRRRLTVEKLSHAIRQAASDPAMSERAATIGAQVAAEDGVARAVELIEAHIKGGSR
ncbi:MAG TPA: glycosyltransferase, partial [bacterium]|nr:glycosyltransferase [bacterium]